MLKMKKDSGDKCKAGSTNKRGKTFTEHFGRIDVKDVPKKKNVISQTQTFRVE